MKPLILALTLAFGCVVARGQYTPATYCADVGSTDAYVCNLVPSPIAYVSGAVYVFKANTANTGAATINFNSIGAKTIVKVAGGITTTLADNDIRAGQYVEVVYDGTNMQMQSTLGIAPASTASPTFTGTVTVPKITSTANCSSSASPAVCTSASAGSIAIPTGVTSVALTVNTSAVTANSQIFVVPDDTLGTKLSVTCNSTLATLVGGMAITARTAATSFEVTYNGTIATNPLCASFLIVN